MLVLWRPCPGCRVALIASPAVRCAACQPAYDRRVAARRGTSAQRGYDSRHRTWAREVLRRSPVCVDCGAPSTIADHQVPFRDVPERKYDVANGVGRCHQCSGRKDGGIRR